MKIANLVLPLLALFFMFASCNEQTNTPYFIDLESEIQTETTSRLSTIADSISYVYLETNDESLLPNISSLIHIDSTDIFIRGGNHVYRFTGSGQYLNRIGAFGMGPEEYSSLQNISVDPYRNQLLFLTQSGQVYLYGYDGKKIKEIKIDGEVSAINFLKDGSFICEIREYKVNYSSSLVQFDTNGNSIKKIEIENDNLNFGRSLQTVSIMYEANNILRFKTLYSDTLFRYENQNLMVHKILHLGKYSPSRDLIEDVNKKSELLNKYVQIVDASESNQYLFLILIMNKKLNGAIVDKNNNKLVFKKEIQHPRNGGGVENDLNKYGYFWPMLSFASNGNRMAQLIHPDYLKMKHLQLESNPIIQIVHLKSK